MTKYEKIKDLRNFVKDGEWGSIDNVAYIRGAKEELYDLELKAHSVKKHAEYVLEDLIEDIDRVIAAHEDIIEWCGDGESVRNKIKQLEVIKWIIS